MRRDYELQDGTLVEVTPDTGPISVFTAPTAEERGLLHDGLGIDEHTLNSVLDPEEISRLEFDPVTERTTIIWKRPDRRADTDAARCERSSMGIFMDPGRLTVVVADEVQPIDQSRIPEAHSSGELVLRMLLGTVEEFLARLRAIKRVAGHLQAELNRTLDNRALVRMFDLTEDLIYYTDAIGGNGVVLSKLRASAERVGFTAKNLELLDDLAIENGQADRQGHIYTTVLAGLLDARGNIVNNNMNVLIKSLTVVNVVFLPLAVISGMGGMSEYSRFLDEQNFDFATGYLLFTVAIVVLGVGLWVAIGAWVERRMGGQAKLPVDRFLRPLMGDGSGDGRRLGRSRSSARASR
jgi:magnesium transporter